MSKECVPLGPITLRRAEQADERNLFEWRNAEETRRYARDTKPIPWEGHVRWFNEALTRSDRLILIGEINGRPIGVLRFDLGTSEIAEISIYLVPGFAGHGLGTALLREGCNWLAAQIPDITMIHAVVLPGNTASHRAFIKAGFLQVAGGYEYRLRCEKK